MQDASTFREFEVFWKKEERSVIAVICDRFGGGSYALGQPGSSDKRRPSRQLGQVPRCVETNISTRPVFMAEVLTRRCGDSACPSCSRPGMGMLNAEEGPPAPFRTWRLPFSDVAPFQ